MSAPSIRLALPLATLLVLPLPVSPADAADKAAKTEPVAAAIERDAGGEPARFRVDMVMQHGGRNVTMRRHVDGARSRMDTEVEGMKVSIIDLGDARGTTYMLMHSEKRAIKSSMAQAAETAAKVEKRKESTEPEPEQAEGRIEPLGTETIDGKAAEKFRVVTGEGDGLMWVDSATQLPLRMEGGGMRVDFKDYDFSPPAPELFELPKKYELLDMDEVMKQMGPGAAGGMGGLRGMAGGLAGGLGGDMGGSLGGQLGAGLGASLGGPVGAMVGQYVGQRIGQRVGSAVGRGAAKAVGAK